MHWKKHSEMVFVFIRLPKLSHKALHGRVITALGTWTKILNVEPGLFWDDSSLSVYVTNKPGQLSLLLSVELKMSTGQSATAADDV